MAVHDAIIELEILTEKVLKAGAYDMAAPYRQSNARIILAELERLRKIETAAIAFAEADLYSEEQSDIDISREALFNLLDEVKQ